MQTKTLLFVLSLYLFFTGISLAGPLSGAIFTTLPDGTAVNKNIYNAKTDVYLDGGPGPNAPSSAAGLPEGSYYFMVTDPSGKTLLSQDPVKCRGFHVNDQGVIDGVIPASVFKKGSYIPCQHLTGVDVDHNAVTVQLMPYANTPNNGGVYKVWATPVDKYVGNVDQVDSASYKHGFVPSESKTDNFKVVQKRSITPPYVKIRKFTDYDWSGSITAGDEEVGIAKLLNGGGWPVSAIDPTGVTNSGYTPWIIDPALPAGTWLISEDFVPGWKQTGLIVDGLNIVPAGQTTEVKVAGTDKEAHEVIFVNAPYGNLKACKKYKELSGTPVSNLEICVDGTDILGGTYGPICKRTGSDGCAVWDNLIPGEYMVTETVPTDWTPVTATSFDATVKGEETADVTFVNYCTQKTSMFTKGYWQNQGCDIVTADDLAYLNTLAPYAAASVSTSGQDNCTGQPCPSTISLPFDSVSELGCYLVAPNSQDDLLGLAQQLAAFILNVRHANITNATIMLPGGGTKDVQALINEAINAWQTGIGVKEYQSLIDSINNLHEEAQVIPGQACPIVSD